MKSEQILSPERKAARAQLSDRLDASSDVRAIATGYHIKRVVHQSAAVLRRQVREGHGKRQRGPNFFG